MSNFQRKKEMKPDKILKRKFVQYIYRIYFESQLKAADSMWVHVTDTTESHIRSDSPKISGTIRGNAVAIDPQSLKNQ